MKTWVITYEIHDDKYDRCIRKEFFDSFGKLTWRLHELLAQYAQCEVSEYECGIKECIERWAVK